jgi:hypothetical protein
MRAQKKTEQLLKLVVKPHREKLLLVLLKDDGDG